MNNKKLIWVPIILGVTLVIGTSAFFAIANNSQKNVNPNGSLISANTDKDIQPEKKTGNIVNQNSAKSNSINTLTKLMTASEVATHNTESSCYVSYQKEVYDLTSFVGRHDGGSQAILEKCGKDINDFSAVHPGGNFSSPKVQRAIKSLVIGNLE